MAGGRIERVRPGRQAEDALVAAVGRAQASDRLAEVSVVVRSPMVGLDLRRRLAARGAFAGTRFTPFSRLIELIGAPESEAGLSERRPLTEAVLGAAIRVALQRAPGVLAGAAEHPATEESLARAYRLLRPLEASDRRRIGSMSKRAGDVVQIVQAVRELLEAGWYDLDDLALRANRKIERGEMDAADVGAVVLHLPDPFGAAQLSFVQALAGITDVTVLAGVVDDPAGDRATDALVGRLVERGFSINSAPGDAGSTSPSASTAGAARIDQVVGAPDLEEEVRLACRLLVAHADAGRQLGRTAVALPASAAASAYPHVVAELFDAAGIPWTGPTTGKLADTPTAKLIVGLFDILVDPEVGFERAKVIGWLSLPGLTPQCRLFQGLHSLAGRKGSVLPAGALDRCSRAAGVVGGLVEWRVRLGAYARSTDRHVPSGAPREVAKDLLSVVERLARLGEELRRSRGWDEVAAWAVKAAEYVAEEGEERDRLVDALSELGQLEGLEPLAFPLAVPDEPAGQRPLGTLGADHFERQLRSAFGAVLNRPAQQKGRFGVGPVVGSITALAGIQTDLLILLGAGEGSLPARTPDDPLVTEIERDAVRALSERERTEDRDRRTTLTLLAGAAVSIVTYPRVSRGASRPAYPSRWLSGDLFTGTPNEVASYSAGIASVAAGHLAPADQSDLELALVSAGLSRGDALEDLPVKEIGDIATRLAAERERTAGGLSRFGGRIGSQPAPDVFAEVMSATRMEALATCPLQFMFDRLVKVEILQAPDRRQTIAPMDRGKLIHGVLEDFVRATAIGLERFEPWDADDFTTLRQIAQRYFEQFQQRGLTGKAIYWQMTKANILADLERFVEIESGRLAATGGRPVNTEVPFGFGENSSPAVVIGTGGRPMSFRGKIDRIDIEPGGTVRVIDYKSGRATSYLGIEKDPLDGGRHLQLPIYAKAALPILAEEVAGEEGSLLIAEFRFCCAEAEFKVVPVQLTEELDEELGRVLGVLGSIVERGLFPPRPGSGDERQPANCRRCDYEAICRLDRTALWQAASEDEEMADYVSLVAGQRG
ncbi:MAG: PD-(D/E)XK nuclease family protein [Acidimicrobiales bacterium]